MEPINIVCVDDQSEVLDSVMRDLKPLTKHFKLEECESVEECWALLDEIDSNGEHLALVVSDHVMPGEDGVSFLTELSTDTRFAHTRKILLTGLATQADTIRAINAARIDHYFEKPWDATELVASCRQLVTEYILDEGLDYQDILQDLDQQTLYRRLKG